MVLKIVVKMFPGSNFGETLVVFYLYPFVSKFYGSTII